MGPIMPVNGSTSGGAATPPPTVGTGEAGAAAGAAHSSMTITASSSVTSSISITQVQSAVSQMLQGLGGSLANNDLLRAIIALLILQAMLDQGQQGGESSSRALDGLACGSGTQQFAGGFASSTSIEIQQSVSSSISIEVSGSAAGAEGQPQGQGGEVDISA